MNLVALLIIIFFVLLILKVPIAFSMVISAGVILYLSGISFLSLVNQLYRGLDSFALLAVPFFMLVGELMNRGGVTDRIVKVSDAWVGHIRGGLGHVNVMVSMLFAGLSGSAAADTAGVGAMMIPTMTKSGFDKPFSAAITAASSTLGVIIPPSIIMIIYGSLAQISIGALFWAGLLPGILIGITQMGYCLYRSIKHNYPRNTAVPYKERVKTTAKAFPVLLLPIIILGGITLGIATATESAAIAVVYGFILSFIVYKNIPLGELPGILKRAAVSSSLPMFCVSAAGIFGWVIAYLDTPQALSAWISGITTSYYGIYAFIVVMLLVLGTFLSPIATIVIFLPLIKELGNLAELNPVHLGLIVNLTLALGMITPPYGICLLISSELAGIPAYRIFVSVIPMFLLALALIIIGIIFPELYLVIPRYMLPNAF